LTELKVVYFRFENTLLSKDFNTMLVVALNLNALNMLV